MLKAHLHGKLRRSAEDDDAVRPLEDTTTAILFERLAYLPDDILINILFAPSLWGGQAIGPLPRTVEDVAFWPRWSWQETDNNCRWLEPDLAITFDTGLLVIEAKRFDRASSSQDPGQIAREWWAASLRQTPVWILAVSGLPNGKAGLPALRQDALGHIRRLSRGADHAADFHLGYGSWRTLYDITHAALSVGDRAEHRRLLADLREGLSNHGVAISHPVWLADFLGQPWASLHLTAGAPPAFPLWHREFLPLDTQGGIRTDAAFFPWKTPA